MSYQILPNIVFLVCVLGIILIILRRLPEAIVESNKTPLEQAPEHKLLLKGLPVKALSGLKTFWKFWMTKIWNFILEAKDLKPHSAAGYRIKKIIFSKFSIFKKPKSQESVQVKLKSEQEYLALIKHQPKNLLNYDALGRFYLEGKNFSDAKDIFTYLVNHEPGNPDFHARLASCYYKLQEFEKAAAEYEKSLALDSTQPNRYYNLGLTEEALGDLGKAAGSFETAIGLEPKNAKFYLSLSNVLYKQGKTDLAKNALLKAKDLDPQNPAVWDKLSRFESN